MNLRSCTASFGRRPRRPGDRFRGRPRCSTRRRLRRRNGNPSSSGPWTDTRSAAHETTECSTVRRPSPIPKSSASSKPNSSPSASISSNNGDKKMKKATSGARSPARAPQRLQQHHPGTLHRHPRRHLPRLQQQPRTRAHQEAHARILGCCVTESDESYQQNQYQFSYFHCQISCLIESAVRDYSNYLGVGAILAAKKI